MYNFIFHYSSYLPHYFLKQFSENRKQLISEQKTKICSQNKNSFLNMWQDFIMPHQIKSVQSNKTKHK